MTVETLLNDEIILLVVFLFGYLLYYFSYESRWVLQFAQKLGDTPDRIEYSIHIPRVIGFVTLGVVPFLLTVFVFDRPLTEYGFDFIHGEYALPISIAALLAAVGATFAQSEKGINIDFYPQVRLQHWSTRDHLRNSFYWTLYLLGYEFLLRGPLFFACLYAFGLIPAIIINSVLYSLIHIYKGKGEAFGAFFFGVLLCLIAYQTHSFLLPFLMHVILAVGNDFKALKAAKSRQ